MSLITVDYGEVSGGGTPVSGTTKADNKVNLGFKPSMLVWYGGYTSSNVVAGVYFKDFSENTYYYQRDNLAVAAKQIGATVDNQGVLYELDGTGFMLKNNAATWANVVFTYIAYP